MALPDFMRQFVELTLSDYCDKRVPPEVRDRVQVVYTIRGNKVTLYEKRPACLNKDEWAKIPVAQFRFDPASSKWTLFCADRNSKWHRFSSLAPSKDFRVLVSEVDRDSTGIFWR